MTGFIYLPDNYRTLVSVFLFSVLAVELGLFIFKISNSAPAKKCLRCGVMMAVNGIMLLCSVTKGAACDFVYAILNLPWLVYAALILLTAVHFGFAFPKEKRRARNSLSPDSVREAIDDLSMGVCFANPDGRIVLINKKMQELAGELLGFCPQMLDELTEAFLSPQNGEILKNDCVRTEKNSVYRFRTYEHTVDDRQGWQQVTAYDVTRQYEVSRQLHLENKKLKKINKKLQKMYDRMNDDIREKESLELKVYVHDTIGRSILTVQDIMQSGEETEQKVQELKSAVDMLSSRHTAFAGTMDEVRRTAAGMGVKVNVAGNIPEDTVIESLAASAARECVTNCVKHAGGNEITVSAENTGQTFRISITNNGKKPEGEIIEGSGLSSLRRSVEAGGGEMRLLHEPVFCLVLKLPGKDIQK